MLKNNMQNYQILEHTADLRIRAFGRTLEEFFGNALKGMMKYVKKDSKFQIPISKQVRRVVKISSPDWNALLVDFLSEALTLADINREVYREAEFVNFPRPVADGVQKKEAGFFLEARLLGEKIGRFDKDIKAVTYHRLDIRKNKEGLWEATIVFDI